MRLIQTEFSDDLKIEEQRKKYKYYYMKYNSKTQSYDVVYTNKKQKYKTMYLNERGKND